VKKIFKYAGILLLGVVLLLILAGAGLYMRGGSALEAHYVVAPSTLEPATDSLSLAHGARYVDMYGCTDCHGSNLAGKVLIDAPPFLVVASNLTAGDGGVGQRYSALDYDRAIRHGVRPDGTPLVVMPAKAYHHFSDDYAAAIIGYLQSLPPVDNELPETRLNPLGRILAAAGQIDVGAEVTTEATTLAVAPKLADTLAYGKYVADMICAHCHQANFKGGVSTGAPGPVPPDITGYAKMPASKLIETLHTGTTPAGRVLDQTAMPIPAFKHWSDEEIAAVHKYLVSL